MSDWLPLYLSIGVVVGIMGVYILCKVEPIGKPDDFGEFLLNCLMVSFVWFFMAAFWPITALVGGLWVVYEFFYGDMFKTAKARNDY